MMKIYDLQPAPDNPQARQYRSLRMKELQQDPRVLSFLSRNALDVEVLEAEFPFFDRWLLFLDNDPSVASLQVEGYRYQLFYENDFFFQYVKTEEQQILEESTQYQRHIVINHLPESMRMTSLRDLAVDYDDAQYMIALTKLNTVLKKPETQGFYLYGGVGSGKTYLMAAMINDLARQRQRVGFINMVRFLQDLKNSFGDNDRFTHLLDVTKSVDILVIDDIGAEVVTDWSLRILIEILDARMNANATTHFTTNLALDQLLYYYTRSQTNIDEINAKRILDRIQFLAKPLLLDRKSQRIR